MTNFQASENSISSQDLPRVTVGVRFHRSGHLPLLERCLFSIAAQTGVKVHTFLALQGFSERRATEVTKLMDRTFEGSGLTYEVLNVPNPQGRDLRSALLNEIIDAHYNLRNAKFLSFIDYDDIWFQPALSTLVGPLEIGNFSLSYADIHCADIYYSSGQTYTRGIKDVFKTSTKTKRFFLQGNFLPLHSYMFRTDRLRQDELLYDTDLVRLEDYDVLLNVARNHPVTGLHRKKLIGLYNFYTHKRQTLNTSRNIFAPSEGGENNELWENARLTLLSRHGGKPWQDFFGEEWVI